MLRLKCYINIVPQYKTYRCSYFIFLYSVTYLHILPFGAHNEGAFLLVFTAWILRTATGGLVDISTIQKQKTHTFSCDAAG